MIRLPVRSEAADRGEQAKPAVWFHTFGCRANQYDTERMRQELEVGGPAPLPGPARPMRWW